MRIVPEVALRMPMSSRNSVVLPGAVRPQQAADLAGRNVKLDADERALVVEGLRDAVDLDERGRTVHGPGEHSGVDATDRSAGRTVG